MSAQLAPMFDALDASDSIPVEKQSEARMRPAMPFARDLRAIARQFRAGDFHGALLDAMRLLDAGPIPILCASPTYLARVELTESERLLVTLIDGETAIEDLLDESGLALVEGMDAICGLLDAEIVVFDPELVTEPLTLPGA